MTLSCTASDHRSHANELHKTIRTGCLSLDPLKRQERAKGMDHDSGVCHCCHAVLSGQEHNMTWVSHEGIDVCLKHKGVSEWHRIQRHLEKEARAHAEFEANLTEEEKL